MAIQTASMDEAMSIGGLVFHRHTLEPLDRSRLPRLALKSFNAGPMTLGTIHYSAGARVVTGAVREWYQINVPLGGRVRTARGGDRMIASPALAAVYGLHKHEFEGFETPTRMLGVKVERQALEHRLEQLLGRDLHGGHIEFSFAFPLTERRPQEWFTIVQILARRLWQADGIAEDPVVLTHLQDTALTGLLLSAGHSFRDELADPARAVTPRAVRRAVAIVDAAPEASLLTVPQLADRVGVGVRALQAGFRASLDTTPLAYLHERRLTHARRELEHSAPDQVSVSAVAQRWGFAHHGRFSIDYRRRFGESPSETLRR
ncbi:AraC family transcriptional regulator [Microbacterium sp.]|uniref:helix-turn-helix transcriptional regulator n=1 Tax=Microbacterium sp. TaxID=51671 RepID=UPI003A90CDB8